jgi:hypothetical protein
MKIRYSVFFYALVMIFVNYAAIRAEVEVSVRAHFSDLNAYGEWVVVPGYGTAWRPDADPNWRPFTYGHWVYSDDGWVWESDEPFGWIVCHYGNWYYDEDQGWVWLPGYEWSPARVRWYVTDDEIGWAPLFPTPRHGFHHHSISMQWTFSPVQFFMSAEVHDHVAFRAHPARGEVRVQINSAPPRREIIQRVVHTPIVSIKLNKVRVTTGDRPLFRVEVGSRERRHVEAPVGPKYRRVTVKSEPPTRKSVTVVPEPMGQPKVRQSEPKVQIHVTHEQDARSVHEEQNDNPRVKVHSESDQPESKARVEVKSKRDDDKGDDNDREDNNNRQEKRRARY